MQLPEDFINQTKAFMDDGTWQVLSKELDSDPPVSIRINPTKGYDVVCSDAICDGNVPWCSSGHYLKVRPAFTFDPLLHAGLYYVQEASSMFLETVLRQYVLARAVRMLDLCAAPGGKSTVARAMLPSGSLLVSNEPIRSRAQILSENMMKFGHQDIIVTNNYPQDFKNSGLMFDVILADVPCSGEGMFRKDVAARSEWSLQNVEKCWQLQRDIVTDAWDCLANGGIMVYSTCTFNVKEDEKNVRYIAEELGAEVLPVGIDERWGIKGSLLSDFDVPVYRFLPGFTRGEGLFMAVLRKRQNDEYQECSHEAKKKKKERNNKEKDKGLSPDKDWLKHPDDFEIVRSGDSFTAIPKAWKDFYDRVSNRLKVLTAGIELGEIKGKDIIPAHSLVLAKEFNNEVFPQVELSYGDAISYLRKESVMLPAETPRGYVVVTFKGVPLGFVKNIGNRANNLYPTEWKIKSSHVPEAYGEIIRITE